VQLPNRLLPSEVGVAFDRKRRGGQDPVPGFVTRGGAPLSRRGLCIGRVPQLEFEGALRQVRRWANGATQETSRNQARPLRWRRNAVSSP